MENKKKVAILGAGVMGTGIAQTFAMAGHEVKIIYVYDDKLRAKPMETMESNLRVLAENQALEESRIPEILGRVGLTEDLEEAAAFADIIFECIVENLAVKQDYFARLDALCGESTILATNTSAISVTEIAEKSVHKERIIGTHFWNPAYLVPLVEVIQDEVRVGRSRRGNLCADGESGQMPGHRSRRTSWLPCQPDAARAVQRGHLHRGTGNRHC